MAHQKDPGTQGVARLAWVLGVVFIASSCGPTMAQIESKPIPPGVSFTGEWFSPEYDNMKLEQKGTHVTGTFSYREGGTISGELDGNVLRFDWEQPGDMSKARRAIHGKGYWVISDDGKGLRGQWGYMDSDTDGGTWNAERLGTRVDPGVDPDAPLFGGERSDPPPAMK